MANTTDSTDEKEVLDSEEQVDEETQDETSDEDQADESAETEETADTEDDESDEDSDDFKPRYTQFKGESPDEYTKNLEDGYNNSSKEAVKLSRENKDLKAQVERINALVATNPQLAQALQGQTTQTTESAATTETPLNPALAFAESQMQQSFKHDYEQFAEEHPEIETDVTLAEDLDKKLAIVRDVVWNQEKRMVGMGEGLNMAWKLLGKEDDTQERIRMAAKDQASSTKSASGAKKGESKSKFTEQQINVAMDMMNVDRAEAIKRLSAYVPA